MVLKPLAKKAVLFSMISLLISTLFIVIFLRYSSTQQSGEIEASTSKIEYMNLFVNSFETYLEDAVMLATKSVLENITSQIREGYIIDDDLKYPGLIVADCLEQGFSAQLGGDCAGSNSFSSLVDSFTSLAKDNMNYDVSCSIVDNSVVVKDFLSFYLMVDLQINYTITDEGFAYWTRTKDLEVLVPVSGLRDPLFYWNADYLEPGNESRIIKVQFIDNTSSNLMNKSEFKNFVYNGTYIAYNESPSYLQRLSNLTNGSASNQGIESTLYPEIIDFSNYPNNAINLSYSDIEVFSLREYDCSKNEIFGIDDNSRPGLPNGLRYSFPTRLGKYGLVDDINTTCS